jgi:hypothetical protein
MPITEIEEITKDFRFGSGSNTNSAGAELPCAARAPR